MGIEHYYIKKGRRYIPVEYWTGFPAEGIWLVKHGEGVKSSRLVLRLAPGPVDVRHLINMATIQATIQEIVEESLQNHDGVMSIVNLAEKIAKKCCKKLIEEEPEFGPAKF